MNPALPGMPEAIGKITSLLGKVALINPSDFSLRKGDALFTRDQLEAQRLACFAAGRAEASKDAGWLPIETAPKDGREFLAIWQRQGNVVQIISWNQLHKFWQCKGELVSGFTSNATGWHELPTPPAATPTKEQP